jgi:hypothetical protein
MCGRKGESVVGTGPELLALFELKSVFAEEFVRKFRFSGMVF